MSFELYKTTNNKGLSGAQHCKSCFFYTIYSLHSIYIYIYIGFKRFQNFKTLILLKIKIKMYSIFGAIFHYISNRGNYML